ncbi:glycosyltransferase family 2 protein [Chryseobacterium luquanense]|uniref:Glycosyltransferase n=1 Tax=Chryseobacterium luquanense TaxID=2983766 RepID=A0ABT3Y047_9FLAO|nr:glycosyltransferase family 2 protein [Chryseobacterium luquanense]MCX8531513.1 glycosyltransferase [Chryseobacterium luquanense]
MDKYYSMLSIIVPVYNVEKYIDQCVNSVLQQSYENFEIILVNDGSPDNCPAICDQYALKDSRIKVIHKKNGGLSDARNFGIREAKGAYILFLDSDDYYNDTDFLLNVSNVISSFKNVDVINFGFLKYYELSNRYVPDGRDYSIVKSESESNREYIKKMLKNDLFIASAWNKCVKKDFILEHDLFFEKGIKSEDMSWCGNILFLMPSMTSLDTQPYVYRQDRVDSITSTVNGIHLNDIINMLKMALVKSQKLNLEDKYKYLSFFAVQYLTLLYNFSISKEKSVKKLHKDVYELKSILKNDLNPKVKKANLFIKLVGFRLTSLLLRMYVLKTRK